MKLSPYILPGLPPKYRDKGKAEKLIKSVADAFGVSVEEIRGESQLEVVSTPRHVAMLLIYNNTELSYAEVSKYFNRRREGIFYGCKSVRGLIETDKRLRRKVEDIPC